MNGVHDMGGMQHFGPVVPEIDEPPFHHAWERRVFALTIAMGATGAWNLDQSRFAREACRRRNISRAVITRSGSRECRRCCWNAAWSPRKSWPMAACANRREPCRKC
jgi:hypothetical protein